MTTKTYNVQHMEIEKKANVKSAGPSVYERRNRKVVKRCLKTGSDGAEVMSSGSSFQMLASATGNDRFFGALPLSEQ